MGYAVRYRYPRYSGCCLPVFVRAPHQGISSIYSGGFNRMLTLRVPSFRRAALLVLPLLVAVVILASLSPAAFAQPAQAGGEAQLHMPDLTQVTFLGDTNGRTLLMWGLAVCALGL